MQAANEFDFIRNLKANSESIIAFKLSQQVSHPTKLNANLLSLIQESFKQENHLCLRFKCSLLVLDILSPLTALDLQYLLNEDEFVNCLHHIPDIICSTAYFPLQYNYLQILLIVKQTRGAKDLLENLGGTTFRETIDLASMQDFSDLARKLLNRININSKLISSYKICKCSIETTKRNACSRILHVMEWLDIGSDILSFTLQNEEKTVVNLPFSSIQRIQTSAEHQIISCILRPNCTINDVISFTFQLYGNEENLKDFISQISPSIKKEKRKKFQSAPSKVEHKRKKIKGTALSEALEVHYKIQPLKLDQQIQLPNSVHLGATLVYADTSSSTVKSMLLRSAPTIKKIVNNNIQEVTCESIYMDQTFNNRLKQKVTECSNRVMAAMETSAKQVPQLVKSLELTQKLKDDLAETSLPEEIEEDKILPILERKYKMMTRWCCCLFKQDIELIQEVHFSSSVIWYFSLVALSFLASLWMLFVFFQILYT